MSDEPCVDKKMSEEHCVDKKMSEEHYVHREMLEEHNVNKKISEEHYIDKEIVYAKLDSGEYRLQEYLGKSHIWSTFYEVRNENNEYMNYVRCNNCEKLFCYRHIKTGTSSLSRHISHCEREQMVRKKKDSLSASVNTIIPTPVQRDIKLKISAPQRYENEKYNPSKKEKLLIRCVSLCNKDFRSFSIFEGDGMIEYSQMLIEFGAKYGKFDIHKVMPSRETISTFSKELAQVELSKNVSEIMSCLNNSVNISFTTSMWFDNYRKNHYYTVTCHYISEDWELNHKCLGFQEFTVENKTAKNVAEALFEYLTSIGFERSDLLDKCTYITNKEFNIKAAFNDIQSFPCTAHIINIVLYYTFASNFKLDNFEGYELVESEDNYEYMEELEKLLNASKNLVSYMKRIGRPIEITNLKQEIETEWNSNLQMLATLAKEENNIQEALGLIGDTEPLQDVDFELINIIIEFLEPFKIASEILEGDKYCTFYGVAIFKLKLEKHLKMKYNDPPIIKILKERAQLVINSKYIINVLHWVAVCLCPKFKSLSFLGEKERQDTYSLIEKLMNKIDTHTQPENCKTERKLTENCTPHESKKMKFAMEFNDLIKEEEDEDPNFEQNEFMQYLTTPFANETLREDSGCIGGIDVLKFWKRRENMFPKLSKIAKSILGIPATVASSERTVYSAGHLIQERRSRVDPECVNVIATLNRIGVS